VLLEASEAVVVEVVLISLPNNSNNLSRSEVWFDLCAKTLRKVKLAGRKDKRKEKK
jgi:hypothetical protein